MVKIKVSKIKYDTEGQDVKLPKSMTIEMTKDEYECFIEDPNELEDAIGDIITDMTDFCVLSFEYNVID